MLKLILIVLCIFLCLLSCTNSQHSEIPVSETELDDTTSMIAYVDWTDFVKFNGQTYSQDTNETFVSADRIGDYLGCIENEVPFEIDNFETYTVPDNSSPIRPTGSKIYAVSGDETAIAVYDNDKDTYYLYRLD